MIFSSSLLGIPRNELHFALIPAQMACHQLLLSLVFFCFFFLIQSTEGKDITAHASHILVDEEIEADQLLKQLNAGADFAELARAHSNCPSGKDGGDLGEFNKGMMVPEFDEVVFTKAIGKVHKTKTQFGYHLIFIHSRESEL